MKKRKKLIITIISIVVVLVVAFAIVGMKRGRSKKKPDRIEVVRRGPFVVKLHETGNLEPLDKVDVRSNVEGEIETLYVDEGYDVVKGQKLLKIDEKQIREEYNQAAANYEAAKAEMNRAKENITLSSGKRTSDIQLAESALKSAQADLEGTKARTDQQLSQAELSITSTKSLLEQDSISLKKIQLALEQAQATKTSAKATLDNAKAELDRKTGLYEKKFVSLREVEAAQLAYASAQSQYESAGKSVESQAENSKSQEKAIENREAKQKAEKTDLDNLKKSIEKQISQAEIKIQQAEERLAILKKSEEGEQQITELAKASANAGLLRAKSVLNKAKERLDWTTVTAPMSGRIVYCKIEEGEIITSGRSAWSQGPPVMIIADLSKMVVKTYVFEYDIGKVKVGQKTEIEVNAYQDEVFAGEVKEISPSGQLMENIIKFEVVVIITKAKPDKPLLPGMTADVDIIVDARDNVLQLPLEAVDPRDTIKIRTDIKKEKASKLKEQDVKIVLKSYPDKEFEGKVLEIAPPRAGFSTAETTIVMDGSPKELQPETSRTADLIISEGETISNIEARIDNETEYFVKLIKEETGKATADKDKVKNKKGKNKKRQNEEDKMIEVGERTQNNIEILGGLKEGDRIRVVPVGEEEDKEKEG